MRAVAVLLFVSISIATSVCQEEEDDMLGMPCTSGHHCWRTEPITSDGAQISSPLFALDKRINLGSVGNKGKSACRCIDGKCRFYQFRSRDYLLCDLLQ
uniref:Uncharacterized protein n=1 Tax=Plectus sambesii TaxID=2011161 RepID=A0A914X5Y5_9BILA